MTDSIANNRLIEPPMVVSSGGKTVFSKFPIASTAQRAVTQKRGPIITPFLSPIPWTSIGPCIRCKVYP